MSKTQVYVNTPGKDIAWISAWALLFYLSSTKSYIVIFGQLFYKLLTQTMLSWSAVRTQSKIKVMWEFWVLVRWKQIVLGPQFPENTELFLGCVFMLLPGVTYQECLLLITPCCLVVVSNLMLKPSFICLYGKTQFWHLWLIFVLVYNLKSSILLMWFLLTLRV